MAHCPLYVPSPCLFEETLALIVRPLLKLSTYLCLSTPKLGHLCKKKKKHLKHLKIHRQSSCKNKEIRLTKIYCWKASKTVWKSQVHWGRGASGTSAGNCQLLMELMCHLDTSWGLIRPGWVTWWTMVLSKVLTDSSGRFCHRSSL